MTSHWKNILKRRDLIRSLVQTELGAQIATTALGWIWWLLDPLLMMLIYWGIVMGLLGRGKEQYAPYPIFLLCSLITWKHFSGSVSRSASMLHSKEGLIKSVSFPTAALPIAESISKFILFLFGFILLSFVAIIWPNHNFSGDILPTLQIPFLMMLQLTVTIGVALMVACAGAFFRDLPDIMTHALRVAYYASPGLYGIDMVHDRLIVLMGEEKAEIGLTIYMLNPFAIIITGYRDAIFYGRWLPMRHWIILSLTAVTLLILGYQIYHRFDRKIVKAL